MSPTWSRFTLPLSPYRESNPDLLFTKELLDLGAIGAEPCMTMDKLSIRSMSDRAAPPGQVTAGAEGQLA